MIQTICDVAIVVGIIEFDILLLIFILRLILD